MLEAEEAKPCKLVVSPAAMVFNKGENRYPFGVFERDRTQVPDADVALYFAKVPGGSKLGRRGQIGSISDTANRKAEERPWTSRRSGPSRPRSKRCRQARLPRADHHQRS